MDTLYSMEEKFSDIAYLKNGTIKQVQAYHLLTKHNILSQLHTYDPLLVGTIPINIDIETSDLDIICCYTGKQSFISAIKSLFSHHPNFTLQYNTGKDAVVASFFLDNFEIEIFGQNVPTKQQHAYRHMIIENEIIIEQGESFRQQILALKRQGYKTEPAFGLLLGLTKDPYEELLHYKTKGGRQNIIS